jgi:hypothetical protein
MRGFVAGFGVAGAAATMLVSRALLTELLRDEKPGRVRAAMQRKLGEP